MYFREFPGLCLNPTETPSNVIGFENWTFLASAF
ncbi:hypothetical protein AGR7A_pAt20005 [Agrobacterium deltaense NCPPB 1641]|uniref:Uncharacterized protein n=1 Tax=Agrobacterium deltaense NCPPB 1641 TaxID=1183425 RepID=A0A1S7U7Y7_9HYPH|nr:hypothetical protein AGR7A_pAt20005 [Agrobacterium deltaense NCPPB 1641]